MPHVVRRLLRLVPTLIGISFMSFALANLAPGDPAEQLLRRTSDRQPTLEEVRELRGEMGLDRPLAVQYVKWVGRALQGDLGTSYTSRRSVVGELGRRLPATLQLTGLAALAAVVVAVPAGMAFAMYRNRFFDQAARIVSLAGASMPNFWLGLSLIVVFAVRFSFLPVAGRGSAASYVLPVITLAAVPTAVMSRFTRSAMLEILSEDYMRTARAKGLSAWQALTRHGLRNALAPLLTVFSLSLGGLLTGTVIVETIFVWPGVGELALTAITNRDYPVIQGFVVYAGATYTVINLLVDLSYGAIDPRIRAQADRGRSR